MLGEILEDYFTRLNLVETRRKYLEDIKEGKQIDKELEEQHFKNGYREQYSLIGACFKFSMSSRPIYSSGQ